MLARRAKDLERGKVLALDSEHQAGAGEGGFPGDPEVLAFQAIRRGGGHFLPSRGKMYARRACLSTGLEFRNVKP